MIKTAYGNKFFLKKNKNLSLNKSKLELDEEN